MQIKKKSKSQIIKKRDIFGFRLSNMLIPQLFSVEQTYLTLECQTNSSHATSAHGSLGGMWTSLHVIFGTLSVEHDWRILPTTSVKYI